MGALIRLNVLVVVLFCVSCLGRKEQNNGIVKCHVLEVPRYGGMLRYRNEGVQFELKNDSLTIRSEHISIDMKRNRKKEIQYALKNGRDKQFMFEDQRKELYDVMLVRNRWKAKIYLYIINVKRLKPTYLFTNDPDFNPSAISRLTMKACVNHEELLP